MILYITSDLKVCCFAGTELVWWMSLTEYARLFTVTR